MIDYGYGVSLDTIKESDLPKLLAYRNDPSYFQYFRQCDLITPASHEDWHLHTSVNDKIRMYAVWLEAKGIESWVVGCCGLTSIDWIHRKAEISCYTEEWKYDLPAMKTLIDHAFLHFGLHRLWTETFETHTEHLKALKALEFREEGKLRDAYFKNGHYIDSIIHSAINPND